MAEADVKVVPTDLSNSDIATKYREAAQVANTVLQAIVAGQLVAGARVYDISKLADEGVLRLVSQLYKSKKSMEKGLAFPTCVNVNNCVAHYSPLESDSSVVLAHGDVVKLQLGVHIDGYCAMAAHTAIVGATEAAPVVGPIADVFAAAYAAAQIAVRLVKPGNKNSQVTEAIKRVADAYGVAPLAGVLSHNLKQFVVDGDKVILLREDHETKVEEFMFEPYQAYALDIVMSSGEGKTRELDARTTVFKRDPESHYLLKMKASRALMTEVSKEHAALPFSLRNLVPSLGEPGARMGVVEPVKHGILRPFPVLYEKDGTAVAHFQFTVLMLAGGTQRITGLDLPGYINSDKRLPDDLSTLLATEVHTTKKSKKKAVASAAAAESTAVSSSTDAEMSVG